MKKCLALTLAALMLLSLLTACGAAKPEPLDMELSAIADGIYEQHPVDLSVDQIPAEIVSSNIPGYTGLADDSKIAEIYVSEPMIGAQPYSLVLVRVKDIAEAAAVAEEMKTGINNNKWICVTADDLRVAAIGDVVMLFMIGSDFADVATADQMVDAFAAAAGRELDVE